MIIKNHTDACLRPRRRAFSLIELLVVIAVITTLAGLSFPIIGAVKRAQAIHRTRAELMQIVTAIESYQHKLGYYPPDNPPPSANWTANQQYFEANQLYFELLGTTNTGTAYQTLDGSASLLNNQFPAAFGASSKVTGFMNCVRVGMGGDEAPNAGSFLRGLRAGQFLAVTTPVTCTVLGTAVDGPVSFQNSGSGTINPWRYNSSAPRYNPKAFDLWVDIIVGGKTNRICNWSEKPLIVSSPYP